MKIFVREHISRVVLVFRKNRWRVEYKKKADDPEYANAYIVDGDKPNSTLAIVSSVIRWQKARPEWKLPIGARTCLQTSHKDSKFINKLVFIANTKLTIIKEDKNEHSSR